MNIQRAFTFTILLAALVGVSVRGAAQQLTTLYNFCSQGGVLCTDGAVPEGYVIQGSDGNFYGTTTGGGAYEQGTVFKLTPSGTRSTLYSFCSGGGNCTDGAQPYAGVVKGSDGNFYGTTVGGGIAQSYDLCGQKPNNTCGTVFKITSSGEFTLLYSFCSQTTQLNGNTVCADGADPFGGLALGSDGNLYGATAGGNAGGTIFKITPEGVLTTLHTFSCSQSGCGYEPVAGLVQGSDGNFYGTTEYGFGAPGADGTVFKITPSGALTTLHDFCCTDGGYPTARLVEGSDGNFYGTTYAFGATGGLGGTVFSISPTGVFTTLHIFCSETNCADGQAPYRGLVQGSDGNFYGMTYLGGSGSEGKCYVGYFGCGTIFKITPTGTLTTLHDFCTVGTVPDCADGALPTAGLVQATDFKFYGLAGGGQPYGGTIGEGIFFSLAALPVARVSPSSLTFASQDEGTISSSQPVTLINTGQEALTVSSVVASGDFSETDNCVGSVAVGNRCTINVFFKPTQTGTRTGTLTIIDNNFGISGSQQTVSLTGTGANPGVNLSATSLAFGNEGTHTTSSGKRVTLTSSGTTSLANISVAIIGPNQADFLETNTCPATLNVGARCTINITFTPSLLAAESATLQVTDNAVNSPQAVALTGTGVSDTTLTPASENFGNVPQEISSPAKNFSFKNNQSVALSISDISFTGANARDFSRTGGTCSSSVAAKASCTISVTFTPSLVGTEAATLSVTSNAQPPYNSLTSTLSGTGIFQATISPTSLTYGKQKVGTTSGAHNLTLRNNLSAALPISGFSFTGAHPGDFNVSTTTCGASLAAKSTCSVSVVFRPTATGTRTATLNVNDSANNSPQTVSLTGTGD